MAQTLQEILKTRILSGPIELRKPRFNSEEYIYVQPIEK